jgi:RNA polymerase sigma factor (sigma-70 family)
VVEDLVQETFARLLQAGPRLDTGALAPFAVVLARNVAVSFVRSRSTEARHLHRLVDLAEPDRPEERTLRQEEARAIAEGLARLPDRDRSALVANEVEGADTATLAADLGSTPGAVAAQLARAPGQAAGQLPAGHPRRRPADCPLPIGAERLIGRGPPASAGPGRRRASARLRGLRQPERPAD